MTSLKDKIIASFDLYFLFGRGVKAFDGSKREMLWSFVWPLAFLPLNLWMATLYPPKGLEKGFDKSFIVSFVFSHTLLAYIVMFVVIAGAARAIKRHEHTFLFFAALNWAMAAGFFVMLPLTLLGVSGVIERLSMDRILVLIQLYEYLVIACIAFSALRLNWQLGFAFAILIMFINQELLNMFYALNDIPKTW